jgi:hypothetical protein
MTAGTLVRIAVVAVLLGACSPAPSASPSPSASAPGPSPSATDSGTPGPTQDEAAVYRQIAAQVVTIRGLDAPTRVEPTIIDRATLQKNVEIAFDKDNPAADIARAEQIEKALGLLASGASLRDLYLKLQGSQVIGYYDPTAKELFIVSGNGGLGPTERLTYAHEFTHELQDRHFDLNGLGLDKLHEDSDRGLAILSLIEGDATDVQTTWMLTNLTPAELGQVAAEASDPALLAVMATMPPILLETSLFPYQAGWSFVSGLRANSGLAAVNGAFSHLPASTEQILHPDKYASGEGPIAVTVPEDLAARFGAGWTESAKDTLGELQTRVWLKQGGVAGDVARTAAEGWGGDRMVLVSGPAGSSVLVLDTVWDTPADATEFQAAATEAIAGLRLDGLAVQSDTRVVVGLRAGTAPSGTAFAAILLGLAGPTAA